MATKKRATRTPSRSKAAAVETPAPSASVTASAGEQEGAAEKVHRALRENSGGSAAQIALAAGVGGSTARKALAALALQGLATRVPSGQRGVADRWHAAEFAPEAAPAQDDADGDGSTTVASSGDPTGALTDDVAKEPKTARAADDAGAPATTTTATRGDTDTTARSSTRLAPGALEGQVEDWLRDHPCMDFGPGEISKKLLRSSGAIANALEKFVRNGVAVRTSDKPKRYRLRDDTNA